MDNFDQLRLTETNVLHSGKKKKLNGLGEYPFTGLQHQVLLELTGKMLLEIA